jgi:AAA family ATP:ADP antiporter
MLEAETAHPRARALLARAVDVRPGELAATAWSFAYFFSLLCGYYILRPLREEMGIRGGVGKLHWVFTATFVATLLAVPLFSALVSRVPRARAIPFVYRFFLLNLLAFYALFELRLAQATVAQAFFVWVSVYNLFVVSIFWGFMADLFTSAQGKRLFGFIAAGGSAGALLGPALAATLARPLGVANLVLLSAAFLELAARCAGRLVRWARAAGATAAFAVRPGHGEVGGTALSGIAVLFRSPYLLSIAAQTILFTMAATFLYFQQARIVAGAFSDPARRTAFFAAVDLAVNVGSLAVQSLVTGHILAGLGLFAGLSLVPGLSAVGFLALAVAPSLWLLGSFQAIRRSAHYAVERPAREVLFTVVTREEKYKSKPFIDTVVYRGGDALSGWVYDGLTRLGLGLPGTSLAALPLLGASVWLARLLSRWQARMEGS